MPTFALVKDGQIVTVGPTPGVYDPLSGNANLRDLTPEEMRFHGWHEVSTIPRPDDTETITFEYSIELVDGYPVEVWTAREKTPEEIQAAVEVQNRATIEDTIRQALGDLGLLINATTTYIDKSSPTQAETVAHVRVLSIAARELAQNQRKIIRLLANVVDGTT